MPAAYDVTFFVIHGQCAYFRSADDAIDAFDLDAVSGLRAGFIETDDGDSAIEIGGSCA